MIINSCSTESVFASTILMCIIFAVLCGILLDGGYISSWAHYFFLPYGGYLLVRVMTWKLLGKYPKLTHFQEAIVYLSPFLGFLSVYAVLFTKMFI